MKTKVVMQAVCVARDGKLVYPKTGEAFDFEDKEVEEIDAMNPLALRDPVNEAPAAAVEKTEPVKAGSKSAKKGADEGL